jgi:hypothetical protein
MGRDTGNEDVGSKKEATEQIYQWKEENRMQTSEPKIGAAASTSAGEHLRKMEHPRAARTANRNETKNSNTEKSQILKRHKTRRKTIFFIEIE